MQELIEVMAKYGGLAGVLMALIVGGMSFAIRAIWVKYNEVQKVLGQLQDKRVEDTTKAAERTHELAMTLRDVTVEVTGAIRDFGGSVDESKRAMDSLNSSVQQLSNTMNVFMASGGSSG